MIFSKTVTLTGESGKEYDFSLCSRYQNFDAIGEIGAVYLFLAFDSTTREFRVLYIGQTSELSERIGRHEKWDCVNKHGCTHIAFMSVPHEKDRLCIETDLRHAYRTKCNDQ